MPTALIFLSVIPVLGGAVRVADLSGGEVTPANARFFAMPVPVLLHIVGATVFCVLGAFQFSAGLRRRRPAWHRRAGRVLVPCGLIAGLTGVWMTAFYPLPLGDQGLLTVLRFVFGSAMVAALVAGFLAIRRRDITRHRAWMMRGYAIAQGAGTQALLHLPWIVVLGPAPTGLGRALLLGAGWMINLAVAEWFIRRRTVSLPSAARTRAVLVETR